MKKKLIAFDIYRTCLSVEWEGRILLSIVEKLNLRKQSQAIIDTFLTSQSPAQEIIESFVDLTTLPKEDVEAAFIAYHEFVKQVLSTVDLFPETLPTLQRLKQQGYTIAAVSNVSLPFVAPIEQFLWDIFDYTLLSCKLGVKKPDKKIFELLGQQSWCSPKETLMIGNSYLSDVKGAQSALIDALLLIRWDKKPLNDCICIKSLDQVFEFL